MGRMEKTSECRQPPRIAASGRASGLPVSAREIHYCGTKAEIAAEAATPSSRKGQTLRNVSQAEHSALTRRERAVFSS